jgi:hypothetical protein
VLLSAEPLDGSLEGKVLGVVDLLGRDGTQQFVAKLLQDHRRQAQARVTKMEDLLPLLPVRRGGTACWFPPPA